MDSAGAVELAVLHTLDHLGYATTEHLHALCFPDAASSTVRLRLATLRAAGYIDLTPWRLPHVCQERGSLWSLSAMGCAYLASNGVEADCLGAHDLGVPSTALERDEWRVRMATRSLLVHLIVRARLRPTFADARVHLRSCWPTPYTPAPVDGDADLAIRWTPVVKHGTSWLPWRAAAPLESPATRYLVHIDRPLIAGVDGVLEKALQNAQRADATAVIIWTTAERLERAVHVATADGVPREAVRMTTLAASELELSDDLWRNGQGRACALQPNVEEARAYHATATA